MNGLLKITLLGVAFAAGASTARAQIAIDTTGVQLYAGYGMPYVANGYPYGWNYGYPYYPWYDPWPYYVYYRPYVLPPLFVPAESLYGPQAVQRFLGTDSTPPLIARPQESLPADDGAIAKPDPPRINIKATNAETKARARKFIEYGDAHFARQKYNEALERYRTAATLAPDLGESYLRQGHALVAMGQYDAADKAFRRGLAVRPDWSRATIELDRIYDGDKRAKAEHFEALAHTVDENTGNPSLLFLLGMQLFFDGQVDRSQLFFQRAADLGGNLDHLFDRFLPPGGIVPPAKVGVEM